MSFANATNMSNDDQPLLTKLEKLVQLHPDPPFLFGDI